MQELTNIDVQKLNTSSPNYINQQYNYSRSPNKSHNYPPFNQKLTQPTLSNTEATKITLFAVPQKQFSLVESISISQPFQHQRKASGILSVRQLKELQNGKIDKNVRRQTVQSQGSKRKIFVSISKSNRAQEKKNISTQDTNRKGISITKYINFKSDDKNHTKC